MMDEFLPDFILEGRDLVAQAQADLAALAAAGDDRTALDGLFRAVHTLKGSVAIFALTPAEALLHAAETTLDTRRRAGGAVEPLLVETLVATIDQVDRWIDSLEADGALPDAAEPDAARLIGRFVPGDARSPGEASADDTGAPAWLAALLARPALARVRRDGPVTAWRYTPDADCFFRGEDPLALVAGVPGLLAAELVADAAWPPLDRFDPFRCHARFEGLSAAAPAAVRAAFRLMPDQIEVATVASAGFTEANPAAEAGPAATLRVDANRLDLLAQRSAEMGVAARALAPLVARARALDSGLGDALNAAQAAIDAAALGLQGAVAGVRLVSLEPVLRRLPRLVREAATALGKPVRFEMTGGLVEVDRQIAEALFEPLLHLARNAVDHGIETPADRAAAGKPAQGSIALTVRVEGDRVRLALRDDGAGIDPAALRARAMEQGLMSAEAAAALDDAQALDLVFLPGFSTAATVTEVSGRGVGMDAVRTAIERLQGTVRLSSTPGQGTAVDIRLPASAIVARLLVVTVGPERLGVRLDQVIETVRIEAAAIQPVGHGHACVLRDRTVPVIDLGARLGLARAQGERARLVIADGGSAGPVALRVDGFGERIDALVRETSGLLAHLPAIGGTTLLGDGDVLLVLDLPAIVA